MFVFYLWGIETCIIADESFCGSRLYFTYEELKHQSAISGDGVHVVCILPMRNWNFQAVLLTDFGLTFVFYLWGIETIAWPAVDLAICFRLYFTYEELKRWRGVAGLLLSAGSLYFTYEELKPVCSVDQYSPSPGLYFTYEELKLDRGIKPASKSTEFVFYLWGIETRKFTERLWNRWPFVFYLWGIETPLDHERMLLSFMFVFYLWGIETHCVPVYGRPYVRLYFTYEELKRGSNGSRIDIHVGFVFYLWGIETLPGMFFAPIIQWFVFYLWGIETPRPLQSFSQYFSFVFYLWGIETMCIRRYI